MADSSAPPDSFVNQSSGRDYWQSTTADLDGMLGGYPAISRVDLQGSRAFLAKLGIGRKSGLRHLDRAVDCGAGIGRITEGLLLDVADTVDIVEPIAKFTKQLQGKLGVGRIFNTGLEGWPGGDGDDDAGGEKYDLVWVQWCIGHLNDAQLIDFLGRCKGRLRDDGVIVVKENTTTSRVDIFDEVDSAVTRQDESFRSLFEAAGFEIVKTELQKGLPKGLFPVRMYGLRPAPSTEA